MRCIMSLNKLYMNICAYYSVTKLHELRNLECVGEMSLHTSTHI